MKCWLEKYNLLDVQPLALAIERSFDCFHLYFGEDANIHQSLPSVAQSSLYRHYDQSCAYIYSFQETEDEVRSLHRSTLCGGLVNCFHRHVYLGVSFLLIYIRICTYIYVYVRIYTGTYTYMCVYVPVYIYLHIRIYLPIYIRTYTHIYVHIRIYTYIYGYIPVYIRISNRICNRIYTRIYTYK